MNRRGILSLCRMALLAATFAAAAYSVFAVRFELLAFVVAPLAAATVALSAISRGAKREAAGEETGETRPLTMFLWWVAACAAGGAIGGLFSASFVGELILFGGVLGLVQWLVLQRYSGWAWLWPLASLSGWVAGQFAGVSLVAAFPGLWRAVYEATGRTTGSDLLGYAALDPVIWAVLGLAQGAVLLAIFGPRRAALAALWVLASSLGGVVSAAEIYFGTNLLGGFDAGATATYALIAARRALVCALYGAATGLVLLALVRARER